MKNIQVSKLSNHIYDFVGQALYAKPPTNYKHNTQTKVQPKLYTTCFCNLGPKRHQPFATLGPRITLYEYRKTKLYKLLEITRERRDFDEFSIWANH